ncbi:hypothetical protein ACFSBG_13565 [Georgenia yuyongxinii]|uniref:hypothetical protein n=1 Tax=Georgenia yuyongxinii TaxID=2589797 RepID=UPI0026967A2D
MDNGRYSNLPTPAFARARKAFESKRAAEVLRERQRREAASSADEAAAGGRSAARSGRRA